MTLARDPDSILLAHSYFLAYDQKQVRRMKPYSPLATMLAAAVVRARGYNVALFDAMLASGVEDFHEDLDRLQPSVVAIVEDNFNFLTKMCTTRMREAALDMIRASKEGGARVVVNGSDAADRPALYLEAGADAVILGEPEQTLVDLLALWGNGQGRAIADVPGLALRNGLSGVRRTPDRHTIANLSALPLPAWDLVDIARYRDAWIAAHGRFSWNMVTSRGCPYRCNWCAKPIFGTRYAQRDPDDVADELRAVKAQVSADHVWFADDIFGLTPQWIETFAREVTARDARIPFLMQSRANLMKPRVVGALAEAGAEEVWLGVESGSQGILDAMDKGTKLDQVDAATKNLRSAGIRVGWFIQLGYPGEEWREILETRDLVRRLRPDDIGVSVSYPLPGTKFYDTVREQLGPKQNWQDSGDLAMMFHGTYPTRIYRQVRDLLHDEARPDGATPARRSELDAAWHEVGREARSALATQSA